MDDYTMTPEWKAWEASVHEQLIPKLRDSAAVMQLVPRGDTDVKFAVELGFSIMMNKPILAIAQPGSPVPPKLARVADKIVEADLSSPEGVEQAQAEMSAWVESLPDEG